MRKKNEYGIRRRVALLAAAALIATFAIGCDSRVDVRGPRIDIPTVPTTPTTPTGNLVTETRSIAGVDGVTHAAVGVVEIDLGAAESLVITAPEDIMPLLTSDVVAGQLILDSEFQSYQGQVTDIQYDIGLRQLDALIHEGVGGIDAEGIDTANFYVEMSGVGDVRAAGRADRQEIRMSGLGDYLASLLETRVTRVDMTAGDAVVWATERIEGRVAWGCTLEYHGNPVVDVTGGGTVRKIGLGP